MKNKFEIGSMVYVDTVDGELKGTVRKLLHDDAIVDIIMNDAGEVWHGVEVPYEFLSIPTWAKL